MKKEKFKEISLILLMINVILLLVTLIIKDDYPMATFGTMFLNIFLFIFTISFYTTFKVKQKKIQVTRKEPKINFKELYEEHKRNS